MCGSAPCKTAAERERMVRYGAANPTANRDASRRYRSINGYGDWPAKRELGLEIKSLKESTPCMDCRQLFPFECMDFDHREASEKSNNVGTMVAHGHNRQKVMAEIAKCDLVCANCHRIRTRKRRLKVGI